MEQENLITLEKVEKKFIDRGLRTKSFTLKVDVGFPLKQCSVLLGHNGAGKTTLIRTILGLVKPEKGMVFFGKEPISSKHRSSIGYMPESTRLPPDLKPLEVLQLQLALQQGERVSFKERKVLAQSLLEELSLTTERDKRIRELSKGTARRLAWAVAIVHKPKLLILDEPFSGLDPLERYNMMAWIRKAKDEEKTLIVSTHEYSFIRELIDKTIIIQAGRNVYASHKESDEKQILNFFKKDH